MSDLRGGRREPPDENEWPGVWAALEKAEKGWLITGPIHAVVSNWKALLAVVVIIAWISRPEIIAAVQTIAGGGQ